MNGGKLRHYVDIQAPILDTDGTLLTNEGDDGYDTIGHAWCSIQPTSSADAHYGEIQITDSSHTIRMRYFPNLTGQYRIKWGERYFNVVGSPNNPDERNIELVIHANEVK
jgi:head-tail adaptor